MALAEKRQHSRIPYFTEAWLEGLDVSRVPCRVADLSVGGAFVDARTTLPAGTRVRMRFLLGEREIVTVAEVRYASPGIGMGLQFVSLSDHDRSWIGAVVDHQR